MTKWKPLPAETVSEYVERVGGWEHSNVEMTKVLQTEFYLTRESAKTAGLRSSSFWYAFYRENLKKMHSRGASREVANRFIQKRNGHWDIGKPTLSETEIEALLDEIGDWRR